jgi:hypothetical protein
VAQTWIDIKDLNDKKEQANLDEVKNSSNKGKQFMTNNDEHLKKSDPIEKAKNHEFSNEKEPALKHLMLKSRNPLMANSPKTIDKDLTENKVPGKKELIIVKSKKSKNLPISNVTTMLVNKQKNADRIHDKANTSNSQIPLEESKSKNISPIQSIEADRIGLEKGITNPEINTVSIIDSITQFNQLNSKVLEVKKETILDSAKEVPKVNIAQKDSSKVKSSKRIKLQGFAGVYYSVKNQALNVNGEEKRAKNLAMNQFSAKRISYSIDLLIQYELGKNWALFTSFSANYLADKSRFSIRGNSIEGYSSMPDQNGFEFISPVFEETEKNVNTQVFGLETQFGIWIKKIISNMGLKISPAVSVPVYTSTKIEFNEIIKNENDFFGENVNFGIHFGLPISLPNRNREIFLEPHFSGFLNPAFKPTSGARNSPLLVGVKFGATF